MGWIWPAFLLNLTPTSSTLIINALSYLAFVLVDPVSPGIMVLVVSLNKVDLLNKGDLKYNSSSFNGKAGLDPI